MKLFPASWWALGILTAVAANAHAQTTPASATARSAAEMMAEPMPYYSAEQTLQGLYGHHMAPLAQAFAAKSRQLVATVNRHCAKQAPLAEVESQWQATLGAWATLSSPALGPLVARRSQREIDFWPTRNKLLEKALASAPKTLADMERVGTPAKGLPGLEMLLQQAKGKALPAATCQYASLVAQGIEAESQQLNQGFAALVTKDWNASTEDAGTAFGEWVNQWLGGLERLHWAHIEKPLQSHRTTAKPGDTSAIEFPRLSLESNLADWRAQWASLRAMARLEAAQYARPPQPEAGLVPIEALLIGKGQLTLAQRWAQAIDAVSVSMAALSAAAPEAQLLALGKEMKALTVMYKNEVAAALDVPLGFSDADGD